MAIRRYSPPLQQVKEEYSRMVRDKVMARRRPPRTEPKHRIPDNSTPWVENPRTFDDLWTISCSVQELVEKFQKWRVPSTLS